MQRIYLITKLDMSLNRSKSRRVDVGQVVAHMQPEKRGCCYAYQDEYVVALYYLGTF